MQTNETPRYSLHATSLALCGLITLFASTALAGTCTQANIAGRKVADQIVKHLKGRIGKGFTQRLVIGKKLRLVGVQRVDKFKQQRLLGIKKKACKFAASFAMKMERKLGRDRKGRLVVQFIGQSKTLKDGYICYRANRAQRRYKWAKGAPIVSPANDEKFVRKVVRPIGAVCFTVGDNPVVGTGAEVRAALGL